MPVEEPQACHMTPDEIRAHIADLVADDRSVEGGARLVTIDVNAPLALIQLSISMQIKALLWVLQE